MMYRIMSCLLLKFDQHPTRDSKLYQEVHSDISDTSVSVIIDSGANSMLISVPTVKQKGLLNKVDESQKVTLSQAEQKKKIETYGVVKGGVSYQMMSKHR